MGAVPPTLKTNARAATRALNASNQTLRKERSDMDSLFTIPAGGEPRLAGQLLHVYRHVDIENLQSTGTFDFTTLISRGARGRCAFASPWAHQAKGSYCDKQMPKGGALWNV